VCPSELIQRTLGPGSLPVACRQFPRITLRDGRGTFVTLSHFCPTAAAMLLEPSHLAIVEAPSVLELQGEVEGLDARSVLPPLLRRDMLTDLDGYDAWERCAVEALARRGRSAAEAVELVEQATERAAAWRPARGPLSDFVRSAFGQDFRLAGATAFDDAIEHHRTVTASIPSETGQRRRGSDPAQQSWAGAGQLLDDYDRAVRAWLAAKVFGNWIAYSAPGLRVVAAALRVYHSVLRVEAARQLQTDRDRRPESHFIEAIRHADLLIVHLSDVRQVTALLARSRPA
jgi:hypothetical protein